MSARLGVRDVSLAFGGIKVLESVDLHVEPPRQGLMDAISQLQTDDIPLLLDGLAVDATNPTQAPLSDLSIQQYFDGRYATVDAPQ